MDTPVTFPSVFPVVGQSTAVRSTLLSLIPHADGNPSPQGADFPSQQGRIGGGAPHSRAV